MIETRTLLEDVSEAPKKPWKQLLLSFAAFTLMGPGLMAYGTGELEVRCEAASCTVRSVYLFGAMQTVRELHEVTEARITEHSDEAPRLQFVTSSETYTVSVLTNLERRAKRRLSKSVNAYLASGAPSFYAVESAHSFFGFVGLPFTVLWALTLYGLITPTQRTRYLEGGTPTSERKSRAKCA